MSNYYSKTFTQKTNTHTFNLSSTSGGLWKCNKHTHQLADICNCELCPYLSTLVPGLLSPHAPNLKRACSCRIREKGCGEIDLAEKVTRSWQLWTGTECWVNRHVQIYVSKMEGQVYKHIPAMCVCVCQEINPNLQLSPCWFFFLHSHPHSAGQVMRDNDTWEHSATRVHTLLHALIHNSRWMKCPA